MQLRRHLIAVAAAAALACSTLLTGQAHAASGAYLRLAHLSPDTPNVDVYVASVSHPDQQVVVPGVGYGVVSDYRLVEPGDYTISMRPAGAAAATAPLLSTTLSAKAGAAYTVAGLGMFAGIALKVLDDDLTLPPTGQVSVRVIHAAATAQQLDVGIAGGPTIATGVAFADTTGYHSAPAGNWPLLVTPKDKPPVTLQVGLAANSVYTVLIVDKAGTLAAELHTDAKAGSSGPVPVGAIETGFGGLAGDGPGDSAADARPLGLAALTMVLVAAAALSIRRAGPSRRRGAPPTSPRRGAAPTGPRRGAPPAGPRHAAIR